MWGGLGTLEEELPICRVLGPKVENLEDLPTLYRFEIYLNLDSPSSLLNMDRASKSCAVPFV